MNPSIPIQAARLIIRGDVPGARALLLKITSEMSTAEARAIVGACAVTRGLEGACPYCLRDIDGAGDVFPEERICDRCVRRQEGQSSAMKPETILSITQRAMDKARAEYDPNDSDETLDSWISDLAVECAADHGFDPEIDEDAACAAQNLFRAVFLAAVGRDLSNYYANTAVCPRCGPAKKPDERAAEHVLEFAPDVIVGYEPGTERREGTGFFLHLELVGRDRRERAATFEVVNKNTTTVTWFIEPASAAKRSSIAKAVDLLAQEGYTGKVVS